MYPNLYYAFKDIFGVEWGFLRFINSFGFWVAISFLMAAAVLRMELKRKSKQGYFKPTEKTEVVGEPASILSLISNFVFGFLFGYKIIALFILPKEMTDDPQAFIFSSEGSIVAGLLVGALMAFVKWYEKHKAKLAKPEKRTIRLWPHDRVGEVVVLAIIFGLLGAKLFDIFENWSGFLQHPAEYIFSASGLTFYGGLICATIAISLYIRKYKINFWHFADAIAPALMLAYAIGRIGCMTAGDGDWGIYNSAYKIDAERNITLATQADFDSTLVKYKNYFLHSHATLADVPHKAYPKPKALGFLSDKLFAYDFPNNVNEDGVPMANCNDGKYCNHLPSPVFPTPFYETIMCLFLFLVLWLLRKKIKIAGIITALYLFFNGIERFLIELIRVNVTTELFGMVLTQAEIISFIFMIFAVGLIIYLIYRRKKAIVKSVK